MSEPDNDNEARRLTLSVQQQLEQAGAKLADLIAGQAEDGLDHPCQCEFCKLLRHADVLVDEAIKSLAKAAAHEILVITGDDDNGRSP